MIIGYALTAPIMKHAQISSPIILDSLNECTTLLVLGLLIFLAQRQNRPSKRKRKCPVYAFISLSSIIITERDTREKEREKQSKTERKKDRDVGDDRRMETMAMKSQTADSH